MLSSMHPRVFDAMCLMFNSIGCQVYVPSNSEPNPFGYGTTHNPPNSPHKAITLEEFLDIKPDVVLCSCWEQINGSINMARAAGSKLVVRAGNNGVPYNKSHSQYLISNDLHTYERCNIPNKLFFYLPPDYDFWMKQEWHSDSRIVSSFIHHYERFWKNSWALYTKIREVNNEIAFINYGVSPGFTYSPPLLHVNDVRRALSISRCMLHVKELEGYGWSMLEAISSGIPVIAVEKYVKGKTCEHFLKEGVTCILLKDNVQEFSRAFKDIDTLAQISEAGREFLKKLINPEEQYAKVKKFMEEKVL
jgi:hypothetical protein